MKPKYNRILLKLSGEALAGTQKSGIDFDTVLSFCEPIKKCVEAGIQVGIVVGGGNFWRGRSSGNMDRTRADHMGMLATAINALGVADALEQLGVVVRVQTAIAMHQVSSLKVYLKAWLNITQQSFRRRYAGEWILTLRNAFALVEESLSASKSMKQSISSLMKIQPLLCVKSLKCTQAERQ